MSKLKPVSFIQSLHGQTSLGSDQWFMTRQDTGTVYTGTRIAARNYTLHPVTAEEAKTTSRLAQASREFNLLDPASELYQCYFNDFMAQKSSPGGKSRFRNYFISRRMRELKISGPLAADASANLQDWSQKRNNE